jgi:hypothetical protein
MKKQRILSVLLGLVLSTSLLPVMGAFVVSPTPGQTGKWSCVEGVTSIPTGYAKTAAKQICNVLNTLETAAKSLDSVAQAIVIPFQLVPNSDGTHDTTYPTGNKPPTTTVAWD